MIPCPFRYRSLDSLRAFLVLAFFAALTMPSPAGAEGAAALCGSKAALLVRPQDEVWLVSTRHIAFADTLSDPAVWQWSPGQWSASDAAELARQCTPNVVTVIYVHGNRIDDDEGASGGLAVYQHVIAPHSGEERVRFLIWSWPSARICGPIKDVRSKACRSDDEAVLLARFLARMENRHCRVGLVGFSFGARIIGGALHLLAGGELEGMTIPCGERPKFQVAFWAAAAHNNWLLRDCRHGRALPLGEKWLNLINGCDESLRHYQLLEKGHNPPALGYTGLAGRNLLAPQEQERWEEQDVSNLVGVTHNYHPYVYSPWIAERTAQVVLGK
jgi:hypothetical protein